MTNPVLIASDGSSGSEGALRVGIALARNSRVPAEVLGVLEPQTHAFYGEVLALPEAYTMLEEVRSEDFRQAIAVQIADVDTGVDVGVTIEVGPPPRTIAEFARQRNASLTVVGSGPRSGIERWMRSETSVKVVQLATTPVLIVPETTRELPTSALVAIDFSDYSIQAARDVIPILQEPGRIFLVHVAWSTNESRSLPSLEAYGETYREGAAARLERLAVELRQPASRHVEAHVLSGDPARELVACASRFQVDLVAAGSHGQGFFSRILMGGVSTRLIRAARWPVLIAPPKAAPVYPRPGGRRGA